jgi:hypothetical protein
MLRSKELSNGLDLQTTCLDSLFHHRDTEEPQSFTEEFSVSLCAISVSLW